MAAGVELGLLYVKDRRLDEADARFHKLEGKKATVGETAASIAGRVGGKVGLAVVLAHRDKPVESNKLLQDVLADLVRPVPKKDTDGVGRLLQVLAPLPELHAALLDALARNAANLPAGQKLPDALDKLRTQRPPPPKGKG